MSTILAHLFGDYVVQTDHMARHKVKSTEDPGGTLEAAQHAALYTACYIPVTRNWKALVVIGGTHYLIDRYRLAKYVVWARNQIAPAESRYKFKDAGPFAQKQSAKPYGPESAGLYRVSPDSPDWLSGWLLFIADNAMHLAINEWAVRRWAD